MALTPSTMLPLGTPAPEFSLTDTVTGKSVTLDDFSDKPLLVMFICNHCPFVIHVREELARIGKDYRGKVGIVAISSNDIQNYPADAPDKMKEMAEAAGFTFPYCYDESQAVAKAYDAACTPDFFLFDAAHKLVYRGQLDETRPGKGTPHGRALRAAIDATLTGTPVNPDQRPSAGCNIKWKSAPRS